MNRKPISLAPRGEPPLSSKSSTIKALTPDSNSLVKNQQYTPLNPKAGSDSDEAILEENIYAELRTGASFDKKTGVDDENEEDEIEDLEEHFGPKDDAKEELIKERIAQSQANMRNLLASLTTDQQQRYEVFRRVGFVRSVIKKMILKILEALQPKQLISASQSNTPPATVHGNFVIAMAGIAKVYVGELVEEARCVLEEWSPENSAIIPLMPSHIMEAQRRIASRQKISQGPSSSRRSHSLLF